MFTLFKLAYTTATLCILLLNVEYIYYYVQSMDWDRFFGQRQLGHCLGLFLGLLFRVSGFLSALTERITLTTVYMLFLIVITILHPTIDNTLFLYTGTLFAAFLYIVMLRYVKARRKLNLQRRLRVDYTGSGRNGGGSHLSGRQVSARNDHRASTDLLTVNLTGLNDGSVSSCLAPIIVDGGAEGHHPSAPPYQATLARNARVDGQPPFNLNQAGADGNLPDACIVMDAANFEPPPAYEDIFRDHNRTGRTDVEGEKK